MKGRRERALWSKIEGLNVRCRKWGLQDGCETSLRQSGDGGAAERRARLWTAGSPRRKAGLRAERTRGRVVTASDEEFVHDDT